MTRTQKLTLAALALIALVFVALIVGGQLQPAGNCGNSGGDGERSSRTECSKKVEAGSGIQALGRMLASRGPRVELPQKRYPFDSTGQVQVQVAPSDDKLRTLKLRAAKGRFKLRFVNVPDPKSLSIKDQDEFTELPREVKREGDDPMALSFAVNRGGGQLTIKCTQAPCLLVAE